MTSDLHTPGSSKCPRRAFWVVVAAVVLWVGVLRGAGLNPESFWFDDLWVASLTRLDSLVAAVSLPVPTPPGFIAALWICKRLVADPEVSLQLVPFVASLAAIPLIALLVSSVSCSLALGVVAATIVAANPVVTHYSVFVKQYTFDFLVTAAVLLMAARYARTLTPRDLALGAVVGAVGILFSFPSMFVSGSFVNVALLLALRSLGSQPRRARRAIWIALAFDAAVAVIFLFCIAGRSNDQVVSYWRGGYLPTDSLASAWSFLASSALEAFRDSYPPALQVATPLSALGLLWLLWRPTTRSLGLMTVAFYGAVLAASAAQAYPIAGGARARTFMFSYPVAVLLLMMGVDALTRLAPWRAYLNLLLCGLGLGLLVVKPVRADYFPLNHSKFVRVMEQIATDSDGIVIWPTASYLAGYYSRWPVTARVPRNPVGGLEIHLERPGTITLPLGPPNGRAEAIDRFLKLRRYPRILYLTTRAQADEEAVVFEALSRHGYTALEPWSSNVRTRLIVFELAD